MDTIRLYGDIESHDIKLELWGASTKHPDQVASMQQDIDNGEYILNPLSSGSASLVNIGQWLLAVASRQMFWLTSIDVAELGIKALYHA